MSDRPLQRCLREQTLTRYLNALREGGSLPALSEADDGFLYVVKFRGAGHGTRALVAEVLGGEIARRLGLKVPEIVLLDLGGEFGITEPDQEIQDLLKGSEGVNVGLHFLNGAFTLDAYKNPTDALTASLIVWLDAFITNVDRTAQNTNMLVWHNRETWLIDHGSSFVFHYSDANPQDAARSPFAFIARHALLHKASRLEEADAIARKLLTEEVIKETVGLLTDDLLKDYGGELIPDEIRERYACFMLKRLENSGIFLNEALNARKKII